MVSMGEYRKTRHLQADFRKRQHYDQEEKVSRAANMGLTALLVKVHANLTLMETAVPLLLTVLNGVSSSPQLSSVKGPGLT